MRVMYFGKTANDERHRPVVIHLTGLFSRPPLKPGATAAKRPCVSRHLFSSPPFSPRTAPLLRPRFPLRPHDLRSQTLGNDSLRLRKLPGPHVASCSGFHFQFILQLWTSGTFLTFLQAELDIKRTSSVFYLTLEMVMAHRRYSDLKKRYCQNP